jgi:hypothetical protein
MLSVVFVFFFLFLSSALRLDWERVRVVLKVLYVMSV